MKYINLCTSIFCIALLLVSCNSDPAAEGANGDSGEAYKRYLVESAIIEYELSGKQSGTETLYFDQWGWREGKYTNSEFSVANFTQKSSTLTLLQGKWIYNINLETKTGTKMENPMHQAFTETDPGEMGRTMLKKMGGKKIGEEAVLGKMCEVWEVKSMNTKSWVWKNINLKTETNMMGMTMNITAINIQENVTIPEDKLSIPADAQINDSPVSIPNIPGQ